MKNAPPPINEQAVLMVAAHILTARNKAYEDDAYDCARQSRFRDYELDAAAALAWELARAVRRINPELGGIVPLERTPRMRPAAWDPDDDATAIS